MRMPSEGQRFNLMDMSFEVCRSSGLGFKAKAKMESDKLSSIETGESFNFLGTKFKVERFTIRNKIATIHVHAA